MNPVTVQTDALTLEQAFKDLRSKFPQEVKGAVVNLKNGLRKSAKELISEGSSARLKYSAGWPRLSGITMRLRGARSGFGGVLNTRIRAVNTNTRATLGWPDRLRKWGDAFQSSQVGEFSDSEQNRLLARGVKQSTIDQGYNRPAREVWNPMINAQGTQAYIIGIAVDRFEKATKKIEREANARRRTRARLVNSGRRTIKRTRRVVVSGARNVRQANRLVTRSIKRSVRQARKVFA